MELRAPVAVAVEIRGPDRRAFRLALHIGADGLALEEPAPFEIGRPVEIAFRLPDGEAPLSARARVGLCDGDDEEKGGRALEFLDPPAELRLAVAAYVKDRLGLPNG